MKSHRTRREHFSHIAGTSSAHIDEKRQLPAFIADNFSSLDEVISALRESGLESSNLILGIDFTKSNEWTGRYSFRKKSLHTIGGSPNPYEQAISIIGRTLSSFDEDKLIPCFGFGDASTHDQYVFSFNADCRPCHGFEEVLSRYREIVSQLNLSGPTSFAPVIHASIDIVKKSNWQYHVLVIIADGQVSRNSDVPIGMLSPQEHATIDAIVEASHFPLSIIMVGVGDGPWDEMRRFDDCIPERAFDNFQFVNFTEIMSRDLPTSKEAAFALAALMEVPFQYRTAQGLRHSGSVPESGSKSNVLPPPTLTLYKTVTKSNVQQQNTSLPPPPYDLPDEKVCPICLTNPKDMAFGCGHLTCKECGPTLSLCPLCRAPIKVRVRLYG